jgi:hypothetical protein
MPEVAAAVLAQFAQELTQLAPQSSTERGSQAVTASCSMASRLFMSTPSQAGTGDLEKGRDPGASSRGDNQGKRRVRATKHGPSRWLSAPRISREGYSRTNTPNSRPDCALLCP